MLPFFSTTKAYCYCRSFSIPNRIPGIHCLSTPSFYFLLLFNERALCGCMSSLWLPRILAESSSSRQKSLSSQTIRYLGNVSTYNTICSSWPNIDELLERVSQLTKKEAPFVWTPECEKSFQGLTQNLVTTTVLVHYRPELPTWIETDVSNKIIAAILSQLILENSSWHLAAYRSRWTTLAKQKY